jgi:hypothetical protein
MLTDEYTAVLFKVDGYTFSSGTIFFSQDSILDTQFSSVRITVHTHIFRVTTVCFRLFLCVFSSIVM